MLAEFGEQADVRALSDVTVTALGASGCDGHDGGVRRRFRIISGVSDVVSFGAAASDSETVDTKTPCAEDLNGQNTFDGFAARRSGGRCRIVRRLAGTQQRGHINRRRRH